MIKQTHIILLFRRVIEFRRVFGISGEEKISFVEGKTKNLKVFSANIFLLFLPLFLPVAVIQHRTLDL